MFLQVDMAIELRFWNSFWLSKFVEEIDFGPTQDWWNYHLIIMTFQSLVFLYHDPLCYDSILCWIWFTVVIQKPNRVNWRCTLLTLVRPLQKHKNWKIVTCQANPFLIFLQTNTSFNKQKTYILTLLMFVVSISFS